MSKMSEEKIQKVLNISILLLLAIIIRVFFLYIYSFDVEFETKWYDIFIDIGRIDAFKEIFYPYSPSFVYLVDITTLFRLIPKEIAIKLISVIFDFFAAIAFAKIINSLFPEKQMFWIGFIGFLFIPTVFIESGMWGQSDIVFTSFLLWSFFFVIEEKPFWAIFFFAISFAFKMQAMFLAPLFVILMFRKKFPLYLWIMIPVVFFISVVPAWLAGGSLGKLLSIYFSQFNTFHSLSMRAPNLYLFIDAGDSFDLIVRIGIAITFLIVLVYLILRITRFKDMGTASLCLDAALLTIFIPFFLPKMHDRYFFAGGLFLVILAFLNNNFIWAAVLSQSSSIISFIPYFTGWSDLFAKIGAGLNVLLIVGLIFYFIDHHKGLNTQGQTYLRI